VNDDLRIGSIVINVSDVAAATAFWAAALHYKPKYEPEPDWVILRPAKGATGPNLSLNGGQTRPEPMPHIHLDLYARNQPAEIQRLLRLGATHVSDWPYPEDDEVDYVVLQDPDGNRFCVVDASDH
jgi:catechol 2,3-dioxygenase-like lactoylglutathione lyase family enzyme